MWGYLSLERTHAIRHLSITTKPLTASNPASFQSGTYIPATRFTMSHKTPAPTPQQIAAACLQIQAEWSEGERQRRLRADERPVVRAADGRHVPVDAADYTAHSTRCLVAHVTALDEEHE